MERKTASDLNQAITEGRYHSQKKRMDFVCADDNSILFNGRKIYLLEDRLDKHVKDPGRRVKQAAVNTECRDRYFVYYTLSKMDTQRTLVNWAYMVRHWIAGGYNSDFKIELTTKLSLFNEFGPKKFADKSQRVKTMQKLMYVDGCSRKDAFYIAQKYPNMRSLYDAWDSCISERRKDEEEKDIVNYNPECMLHRNVSVFADWKFKHDLLQTQEYTARPDDDIIQCIDILNNSGFDDGREQISKELSRNIFSQFYVVDHK